MPEDILNQLGNQGSSAAETAAPEEEDTEIKTPKKKPTSGKTIDDEVLQSLMANGDNSQGMFTPDEKEVKDKDEKLHEDVDKKAEIKSKGTIKPSKKYETQFQKDIKMHPEKYTINTPRGEMTVKEAIEKGYDPITHRFNAQEQANKKLEELKAQLNDNDKAAVERLSDPKQLQLAPADADKFGLSPMSPMRKSLNGPGPDPVGEPGQPGLPVPPEATGITGRAAPAGDPRGIETPEGGQMPTSIESILGGKA